MRELIFTMTLAVLTLLAGAARAAEVEFNIKAQPLANALATYAEQADLQVLFPQDFVRGLYSREVRGKLEKERALELLLEQTGLEASFAPNGTVLVKTSAAIAERTSPSAHLARVGTPQSQDSSQTDSPANSNAKSAAASGSDTGEIIVTAQKRAERLLDTPQSVSVLSAETLEKLGAIQLRDWANTVPGLSFTSSGAGWNTLSLRGVTSGADVSSTVGVYLDEVPYGSSTAFAGGAVIMLDAGLFDLDRIEVLRGPQGTLYGASALGGLVKYVTVRPDPTRFAARAQGNVTTVEHGGISHTESGAINLPFASGKAALRATGFHAHDGGFIDNAASGKKDIDSSDTDGGRLDLLIAPNDALSIRLNGFVQDIDRGGVPAYGASVSGGLPYGDLATRLRSEEPFHQRSRILSGTLDYDVDWARLTSITSYSEARFDATYDYSAVFDPAAASFDSVAFYTFGSTKRKMQELRLTSPSGGTLEWLLGGFYSKEDSNRHAAFAYDPLTGAPFKTFSFHAPSGLEEHAVFGDLTWHLDPRFDITGGVRYARNQQRFAQFTGNYAIAVPLSRSEEDVTTYLANARYRFNEHATAYVRYATGYRPGGANYAQNDSVTGLALGPSSFEADRLTSYEAGIKLETQDRRFGLDMAVYQNDWSNVQILSLRRDSGTGATYGFYFNAPEGAMTRGVELTMTARPTPDFTFAGALAVQDATLSGDSSDLGADKDDRLPNVPRFTGTLNADYRLPLQSLQSTVGATLRYVSDRWASFDRNIFLTQYHLPEYSLLDLRAGVSFERIDVRLVLSNLLDKRGQLSRAGAGGTGLMGIGIVQPRALGLTASFEF